MQISWEAITAICAVLMCAGGFFAFLVNLMVRNTIAEQFALLRDWARKEFATEKEIEEIRRQFESLSKRIVALEE